MRVLASLILIALSLPAFAQEGAPLPQDRPEVEAPASEEAVPAAEDAVPAAEEAVPLPRARPQRTETETEAAVETPAEVEAQTEPEAPVVDEIVPEIPEPRIYQAACPAVLMGAVEAQMLEPIAESACGEQSPLAVTAVLVNGRMVPLSGEAIMNCGMASALPEWAAAVDGYLMARENTRLTRILVGTSYYCRPRNNVAGSDVSEHGFANALDVTGLELEDGRTMTLPEGWSDPLSPAGRLLRFAHDAACARFTTTLGPEANAQHADHLHFDLGCHGARCTARLCE